MEGPTPVSALIHAATMVTAGVFLLVRISGILEYAPTVLLIISILGAVTAFVSGSIGLVQNDIKKVIAYSTCSQLGYMVFGCGLSQYSVSLYHLFNHGFYKGLLFLCAGSIIHGMMDQQDIRKFGGVIKNLPVTYIFIFIGSLSLMG
jgi:NADH-ubiquinone oxidoreductase chain 5